MRKVAAIFTICTIICFGCRSTKFVSDGDYLLDNVSIESDNKEIKPQNVTPFVKQKPNLKILGVLKMHLMIYNLAPKKGTGWVSRSLKKMGKEPIIYDENYTVKSEREIKRYLSNKGFAEAEVRSDVKLVRKKANVTYQITCNTPYRIKETAQIIQDTAIARIIQADSSETLLKEGNLFDLDVLDAERERLTEDLRNKGYYNFNKKSFHYKVDTTLGNYEVKDIMILQVDSANPQSSYTQYTLKSVNFIVGYNAKDALKNVDSYLQDMDTVVYNDLNFLSKGKSPIKPETIFRNNLLRKGHGYNKELSDLTHSQLSGISIIRYVNISYTEVDSSQLNCNVYISLGDPQTFSFEVEGTNISGNFGGAATVGYMHKNLFNGAEILDAKTSGGYEAIVGLGDNEVYYSRELGVDIKLTYPKFVFPFISERFNRRSKTETDFLTSWAYQERPEYSRSIATTNVIYNWNKKKNIKHQLTPIMFSFVKVDMTSAFQDHIDTTEYLKYSYDDHVIIGSRYAITFQGKNELRTSKYLRLQLETAGNTTHALNLLSPKTEQIVTDGDGEIVDQYYDFMNVRYSQYVKFDINSVVSHNINESNTIAYRLQLGLGIPYGNSTQLPFEKRYFGGGANGVRAWIIRSLGPGTYLNETVDYYNQSGDINLIASLEYRFKMFWLLEGALFADAGNVWAIHEYEEQPGAAFKFDSFYKEIALGVGAGLRLDLSFFVFRFDMAYKAYDPTNNNGWVLGTELGPTTHLAIGYPF